MDEFGVLVESTGFKSQRNSAPMALLKSKPNTNFSFNNGFPDIPSGNPSGSSFFDNNNNNFSFVDDLDGIFQSNGNNYSISNFYGDDLLTSEPRKGDSLDDFFGNLKKVGEEKGSQYDDLIPGFGETSPSRSNEYGITGMASETNGHSSKSSSLTDGPVLVFESSRPENASSWAFYDLLEENAGKSAVDSSLDEFEKFARGMPSVDAHDKPGGDAVRNIKLSLEKDELKVTDNAGDQYVNTNTKIVHEKRRGKEKDKVDKVTNNKKEPVVVDIFGLDTHSNINGPRSRLKDPEPEVKVTSKPTSSRMPKVFDGFSSLFEGPEFEEIEGESEERRRGRLNQQIKTQERMNNALAEKRQRDLQSQYEQEERRSLADSLDEDIKRWSAGKENNLRALLSSLENVLWPESGWRPVSLADLITPVSVNAVYRKASICIHPDKVQQRGCNLRQKYIAEKVFDVLKEARSSFNEA